MLGFMNLVTFIVESGRASTYNIKGVLLHMTPTVFEMVIVVAASSYGMDKTLMLLLKDDRVPRQLPEIDKTLLDELTRLGNIPLEMLAIVECNGGCRCGEPSTQVVRKRFVQYHFPPIQVASRQEITMESSCGRLVNELASAGSGAAA